MDAPADRPIWVPTSGTRVRVVDGPDSDAGFTGTVRPASEAAHDAGATDRPCVWVAFDQPYLPFGGGAWYPTYRLIPITKFEVGDRVNRTDLQPWGDDSPPGVYSVYAGVVVSAETLCVEVRGAEGVLRFIPVAALELVPAPTFQIGDRVNRADGSRCDQFGFVLAIEVVEAAISQRTLYGVVRVGWSNGDDRRYHPNDLVKVEPGEPLTLNARTAKEPPA